MTVIQFHISLFLFYYCASATFRRFLSHTVLTRLCICQCAVDAHQCLATENQSAIVTQHGEPFTYYRASVTHYCANIVLLLYIYILLPHVTVFPLHIPRILLLVTATFFQTSILVPALYNAVALSYVIVNILHIAVDTLHVI